MKKKHIYLSGILIFAVAVFGFSKYEIFSDSNVNLDGDGRHDDATPLGLLGNSETLLGTSTQLIQNKNVTNMPNVIEIETKKNSQRMTIPKSLGRISTVEIKK